MQPYDPNYTPPDPSTQSAYILAISKANPGVFNVAPAPTFAVGANVFASGVGGMAEVNGNTYAVTSIVNVGNGTYNVVLNVAGVDLNTSGFGTYTSGGSLAQVAAGGTVSSTGVGTCQNNLFDNGAYNTVSWAAVTGAQRYYVYKLSNGLFGYIGQTKDNSFTDDNIAADISKTPPISNDPFFEAGRYPTATGYFEQRRCFGGTTTEPSKFWATKSATEANLSYQIPGRDDDAIIFTIAARERQAIRHIVPMANLILLTESGEWRVAPADGAALTPDVSVRQQSAIGSSDATPVVVNNNLIFAAGRGGHVRELAYNFQANGYLTGDISLRATHLFDGYSIVDIAYAKAPVPIVWAVSTSGNLLGLTYVPEQEVGAWHRHDTADGLFEHVAVVPEGEEDALYAVVKRGDKRYIERMATRQNGAIEDAFFVDCGLTQTFDPAVTTISGLDHLEGKTVAVLGDGAVFPQQVVTGGAITLDQPVSKVTVGLPITADIKTLPLAVEIAAYGQGRPKDAAAIWLRVFASSGVKAGPSFDRLVEYKQRTNEPYGTPPAPITDEVKIAIPPSWTSDGGVCVRQDAPLPLMILSATIEFAVGGG